jgi:predicted DNA-binding protein (MmcQ/YjbR family)
VPDAETLRQALAALPGVTAEGVPPRSPAVMYKVGGKLFAILSAKGEWVIVKSDPPLIELLKEQHPGIGHRSHLDRRFWISVPLDAGVPYDLVRDLALASYDRIRAGLPRKRQAELAASTTP